MRQHVSGRSRPHVLRPDSVAARKLLLERCRRLGGCVDGPCAAGSTCLEIPAPDGWYILCLADCWDRNDCRDQSYACAPLDAAGSGVCVPACTSHDRCLPEGFCQFQWGLCEPY